MGRCDLHIKVGISDRITDLVIATSRAEDRERTGKSNIARKRQSCSNIDHVLFSDAYIEEPLALFLACLGERFRSGRTREIATIGSPCS